MGKHTYKALERGVAGKLREEGEIFTHEFLGIKRDKATGKPVKEDGEIVRVAIDDPSWVERLTGKDKARAVDNTDPFPGDPNLDAMSVAELKAYAAAENIDLGEAKKKDDILAVIKGAPDPDR